MTRLCSQHRKWPCFCPQTVDRGRPTDYLTAMARGLWDKFLRATQRLLPPGSCVVIGTSGGPDSQVLLDLLASVRQELSLEIWACGIDHGFRAAAGEELSLARGLAQSHNIPFESIGISVQRDGNLLANARHARYRALREFADRAGADRIAVAHTATDQVESVLLNITRGAALRGARGIPWQRGPIVRPLLEVSRTEVLAYARDKGLHFASDPSNQDPQRARTKLRHHVLETLRELNPQFEESFGRFATHARRDEAFLNELATQELMRRKGPLGSINLTDLSKQPTPIIGRLLRQWLENQGLRASREALDTLESGYQEPGFGVCVGAVEITHERGYLWAGSPQEYSHQLSIPGRVEVEALGLTITAELPQIKESDPIDSLLKRGQTSVAFDLDRLHFGMEVRSWKTGDKIKPYGLQGHTKVGDIFTDLKIPRALRAVWPLLTCGDDVLWIVGLRRGGSAPIGEETRRVLTVDVLGEFPW